MQLETSIWHYFLFSIIIGLLLGKHQIIKDWTPFLGLWVLYDMTRGIADNLSPVHVREVYDVEMFLFGWMFNGQIPSEWAQDNQYPLLTLIAAAAYTMHLLAPLSVALLIYYGSNDRETFREFKFAFIITIYLALLTFILYPVAPPWYTYWNGFEQPAQQTGIRQSAGNLINVDNFFETNFYGDFYSTFNSNPYAAMPSLHAGFSYLATYYFISKYRGRSKLVYLSIIYPITVWLSAVYLNHHYIVDLIGGVAYSYFSIRLARKYLAWRNAKSNNSAEPSVNVD